MPTAETTAKKNSSSPNPKPKALDTSPGPFCVLASYHRQPGTVPTWTAPHLTAETPQHRRDPPQTNRSPASAPSPQRGDQSLARGDPSPSGRHLHSPGRKLWDTTTLISPVNGAPHQARPSRPGSKNKPRTSAPPARFSARPLPDYAENLPSSSLACPNDSNVTNNSATFFVCARLNERATSTAVDEATLVPRG